mmetsp:Transcript_42748/g.91720  ORF Transcript_42748/g.91720 Transcript_42748/m.91720 type:complete len:234 (-) Transcript_42748:1205-1906(-)
MCVLAVEVLQRILEAMGGRNRSLVEVCQILYLSQSLAVSDTAGCTDQELLLLLFEVPPPHLHVQDSPLSILVESLPGLLSALLPWGNGHNLGFSHDLCHGLFPTIFLDFLQQEADLLLCFIVLVLQLVKLVLQLIVLSLPLSSLLTPIAVTAGVMSLLGFSVMTVFESFFSLPCSTCLGLFFFGHLSASLHPLLQLRPQLFDLGILRLELLLVLLGDLLDGLGDLPVEILLLS